MWKAADLTRESDRVLFAARNLMHVAFYLVVVLAFLLVLRWMPTGFWLLLGAWRVSDWLTRLACIAVIAAWLIYRTSQATSRYGVILALETELDVHRGWVGTEEWTTDKVGQHWDNPWYSVFQLSTVALDNAITQGPSLLLSRELLAIIVRYRQQLRHLSQLIEAASAFQIELARGVWTDYLIERIRRQTATIHREGIGDRGAGLAYYWFQQARNELFAETHAPMSFVLWFLTGLRVYRGERLIYYGVWQLLSAGLWQRL